MKLAINGLGRIGRNVLRAHYERSLSTKIQIAALNERADLMTLAHLIKYDSTHGLFREEVSTSGDSLLINDDQIAVTQTENINELNWQDIDLVMECTGAFDKRSDGETHLKKGAKRVLFFSAGQCRCGYHSGLWNKPSGTKKEHTIISAASCTTYSSVPVIKVLDDELGIENGMITTIHSAMNDQPLIDAYHNTNLRLTRSAFQSIIPVKTALAKGIERILPSMAGKFEAQAIRVPTINVSAIDLTIYVKKLAQLKV